MSFVEIDGVRLEYMRIEGNGALPPIVMLHEGLGSLAMWRDFPQRVAAATGAAVIVYSRRGYGQSDPLPGPRGVDYMHGEAQDVLPKLLKALGIRRPFLIGHSDGASIAIIHAGSGHEVAGLMLMAPHVFVEDVTVSSIAAIKEVWKTSDMAARLGRYHRDAEHTFWGWNDIWLLPAFKQWNIEDYVPRIAAPILAIQGLDDEYGTPAQCEAIKAQAKAACQLLMLENCKHSPHRDQPGLTLDAISRFFSSLAAERNTR
ncbi:MAG TPA: alpha/beta hydrolase [Alphaproteobacteria bacterium]|nr:alpha/beta hydrolase [Alphaproteobacteria bacterium]